MSSSGAASWQDPFTVRLDSKDPHLRIHCVIMSVSDQDRSLKFYIQQLGFTLVMDVLLGADFRWIEVAPPDGSTLIALVKRGPDFPPPHPQASGHVVFVTEDVPAKYKAWSARGVRFHQEPGRPGWSPNAGTFTSFEDPDGNTFSLINFDEITRDIEQRRRSIAERLEAERRSAHELEIAKEVQSKLFPQNAPEIHTLDYAGLCLQARQVGGDYYDFLQLGPERFGLIIGDIAGKGIAAALLMANLQANLRSQCAGATDHLHQLLHSVNRLFHQNTTQEAYATLFFGEYRDDTHTLQYANCGHLPALLLKRNGELQRLDSTCTVVGLFGEWECAIAQRQLSPGDTLVLYTDGVTESFNDAGEDFGEERLIESVLQHRHKSANSLLAALAEEVRAFSPREQHDDITMIVAQCRE